MKVSPIPSPFDPFAASSVQQTARESNGKNAPTADAEGQEHPARPAETPAEGLEQPADSDVVGKLIDVRV
jgi:hypothetical protein